MQPRVIIAGTAQNCSDYLSAVLKNIDNISELFSETGYVFVENDSSDNTRQLLQEWGGNKSNFHLINFDGLNRIQARTVRLEIARNAYIEAVKYYENLKYFDYLVVFDMDEVGAYPVETQAVHDAIEFLESSPSMAAAFANQKGAYYDMWALRHPTICPNDVWEEVLNYSTKNNCSDDEAYAQTLAKKIFSLDELNEPIQVDSAFGGMGIYKMQYVLNNPNPYLGSKTKIISLGDGGVGFVKGQVCEHVHFHAGIKSQGGEMFILPTLINGANAGVRHHPSIFRGMISELFA
jgi:glycosyltransferase involved in cell wall biosynthesis